jgi:hypothetical protein
MKNLKYFFYAALTVSLMGCTKSWLEDYTVDPARPSDVSPQVLLPSAQISYAMAQGDVLPRLTSIFMQQMTGTDRQSLAHNRYAQIGESDFDQVWGDNGYAGGMLDLKIVIEKTDGTSPHYAGVARIMTAMYLGLFTDVWGDIPYNEAMQGADIYNPVYQTQEQIYTNIQTLLDAGIANLGEANSVLKPGSEDLIFKGDLGKWEKLAHGLKARYLNHLSKKGALYNPTAINAEIAAAMGSNGDDAKIAFLAAPNTNPWYQFNSQREGYISQFGYMYETVMIPKNDPRVAAYRSADSVNMPFYGSQNSPLNFMTFAELKFIEAEVIQRTGGNASAQLADAVTANMDALGIAAADRDAYLATLPANPSLEDIMTEKYVAMFSHVEAWTDWRRTGFPNLAAFPGAQFNQIPRRLPYPETERLYNSNFIDLKGENAFLTPVWWDNN